jgi:hypothetical protein
MATTTNYGWATPDDTDLVKDGAAAIRTLGTSIDTSFAADEGDLLVGGTSDIFEALPIGAAGTVLTSDGDTAEWAAPSGAGDFTLISRTSFSNVATQDFDNVFTSTYPTYRIIIEKMFAGTNQDIAQFQVKTSGGVQNAAYFGASAFIAFNSTSVGTVANSNNLSSFKLNDASIGAGSDAASNFTFDIVNAGVNDNARWMGLGTGGENGKVNWFGGFRNVTETVTGFRLSASTTNITGTVAIYGYGA